MASIDDELNQIERDIRTLKIEFEQYFGGGRKRPPTDTQWRLETLMKRHSERLADLNYGQRFRYNNLAQTYAKYQDMWRKKIAQRETAAEQRHFGAAAKAIAAERAKAGAAQQHTAKDPAPAGNHERKSKAPHEPIFKLTFSDLNAPGSGGSQSSEKNKVEELYKKMAEARQQTGESAGIPSLKDFEGFVARKTQELQKKGANQVEYALTIENGRVKLKARISN
ncbi:MAG TPA: MXAN_5187 C-terminal domain-containing protein [Candidatus Acidoferrales bacterium]|nr:MXAN_5187 C-terminal domain-containing protein [Candidatus Acidoferrales bacterium]